MERTRKRVIVLEWDLLRVSADVNSPKAELKADKHPLEGIRTALDPRGQLYGDAFLGAYQK